MNEKYHASFFGLFIDLKNPQLKMNDLWYNVKLGFKNIKRFFHAVWWFRESDFSYTLNLLEISIQAQLEGMEKYSNEEDESKKQKMDSMRRAIEILKNNSEDNYADRCGYDYDYNIEFIPTTVKDFGGGNLSELVDNKTPEQRENNKKALEKAMGLEQYEFDDLVRIINDQYSGLRSWWY